MVASRTTSEVSPASMAREMAKNLEQLAANDQWNGAEQVVARLSSVILEIPEDERREVLEYVSYCLERVRTQALSSRGEVTSKLSEIRRGRDAARAYGGSLAPREQVEAESR